MIIGVVAVWLWAESIVGIFSSDPGVVEITSTFLRIAIPGFLAMGFLAVAFQWLNGVGDTLPPMVIGMGTIWLVQLPLAYFLPQVANLGVYGVRWAIVISLVVGVAIYPVYLRTGRWKHKRV